MAVFVLERYASGLTLDGVHQAAARVAATADVIHLLSLFVPGDDAALSVFTADTMGQLEGAARCEGTPFERIVQAVLVEH